ncbi:hypothetical protein KFL_006370050 [Klebsormidium nitens]|uniref:YjgP/YjgQ family permease n=1 Tax=Klebsormidium nitens TaxID=105231 RepID=A0A1Y1IHR4_KLENI|nr:hypothetical protein KFL_006370050 [Klebsormidium nitens]|eukprot:GAQ90420.1 hypothetical protein KFL_006370050 [Klebsormidium nitens]
MWPMSITRETAKSVGWSNLSVPSSSWPVLDQYLLQELIQPLLYGLLAFSSLAVSIGTSGEVSAVLSKLSGLAGARAAAMVLILRIPHFLALALPMASLLAPLLAFGRLGASSEIVALQSSGVKTIRMVVPAALLFLGVTLVNLLLSEGVAPFANARSTLLVETPSDVRFVHRKARSTPLVASRHPIVYPEFHKDGGLARLFFARRFDSSRMLDVTLVEMQPSPEPETTTSDPAQLSFASGTVHSPPDQSARSSVEKTELSKGNKAQRVSRAVLAKAARWQGDGRGWIFLEGAEYCYDGDRVSGPSNSAPTLPKLLHEQRSLQELHTFQQKAVFDLAHTPIDLAQAAGRNFDDMSLAQVTSLQKMFESSRNVKESRKMKLKMHQRLALPFACFVFGVLGSLVSLRLPSDQKRVGFALTLAIVFGYYAMSVTGSVLAQLVVVPPLVGAWLPNLFGAASAVSLFLERE